MEIFDGRKHAQLLDEKILSFLKNNSGNKQYLLAVVQIGDNKSSEKYVQIKKAFCERMAIAFQSHVIDPSLDDATIIRNVSDIFKNPKVFGGIIQLPFPRKSLDAVLNVIPKDKDVDLLSKESLGNFYNGDFSRLSPVVRAYKYFLDTCKIDLKEKKVIVIGEGFLVGKPISFYSKSLGADVSILKDYQRGDKIDADIAILSTGIPNLVSGGDIREGCSVIDYGSNILNGKTVGDLNLQSTINHLKIISPSPGGVGPLVVRFLIMNLLNI